MAGEDEVRKASAQFYAALNRMLNGDAGSMSDIWSQAASVTTMHPIGGRQVGWDAVRGSWEAVAGIASEGRVTLEDQLLQVAGDMAVEVGVEHGAFSLGGHKVSGLNARVTNVYRREADGWKIVHHHTDESQSMIDVLNRLKG